MTRLLSATLLQRKYRTHSSQNEDAYAVCPHPRIARALPNQFNGLTGLLKKMTLEMTTATRFMEFPVGSWQIFWFDHREVDTVQESDAGTTARSATRKCNPQRGSNKFEQTWHCRQ